MKTTRQEIAEFNQAFDRPLNNVLQESLSVDDRVLLAKLLLEETVEYVTKGLGLKVYVSALPPFTGSEEYGDDPTEIEVIDVGCPPDMIEAADGLGDVNVVAHFNAHWHGMNLDRITSEIHRSNMSKLGADGKPIINYCVQCGNDSTCLCGEPKTLLYPDKPIGKIIKGPNFEPPKLGPILAAGNWFD